MPGCKAFQYRQVLHNHTWELTFIDIWLVYLFHLYHQPIYTCQTRICYHEAKVSFRPSEAEELLI